MVAHRNGLRLFRFMVRAWVRVAYIVHTPIEVYEGVGF